MSLSQMPGPWMLAGKRQLKHKIIGNNKGVLCIIHTVKHNYIYVLVHKENNNYMFRSYLWTIFRLSINL
jgi:hypothetical protein